MQVLPLAHISATDIGFGLGLFLLGVVVGALLLDRVRNALRKSDRVKNS